MQGELDQLVRRLRHLPARDWPSRRAAVVRLLAELSGGREVPDLPDHALADAVAVVGGDAIDEAITSSDASRLAAVRAALVTALTATR